MRQCWDSAWKKIEGSGKTIVEKWLLHFGECGLFFQRSFAALSQWTNRELRSHKLIGSEFGCFRCRMMSMTHEFLVWGTSHKIHCCSLSTFLFQWDGIIWKSYKFFVTFEHLPSKSSGVWKTFLLHAVSR